MRLWHYRLIPVLPRQQLVAQWREISAIAGNIKTKGIPNHMLVNKIMDYPLNHFITYAAAVRSEMTKRGYRTMDTVWDKIVSVCPDYNIVPIEEIYPEWHNFRYLRQCFFNLQEKFDCGGISKEEWDNIEYMWDILGIKD